MRGTPKGELSAGMAILGLLIERPDTAGGVAHRLATRFARAGFARSATHNTLASLVRQGLVEVVISTGGRAMKRYAPTSAGLEVFQSWLCAAPASTPFARDALQARLEFARGEHLLFLLEAIIEEERRCAHDYRAAHARVLAARTNTGRTDHDLQVRRAMLSDEAMFWALQFKRLRHLRRALEAIAQQPEVSSELDVSTRARSPRAQARGSRLAS